MRKLYIVFFTSLLVSWPGRSEYLLLQSGFNDGGTWSEAAGGYRRLAQSTGYSWAGYGQSGSEFYREAGGLYPLGLPKQSPTAVELSSFSFLECEDGIGLVWQTESETGSYRWLVQRSVDPAQGFATLATLPAAGTSTAPVQYRYRDKTVAQDQDYYYRLGEQDLDGSMAWYGPIAARFGQALKNIPRMLTLNPAFPNPGRHPNLRFGMPTAGRASVRIYSILGALVRTLSDDERPAGWHTVGWDGRDNQGRAVSSGVYLFRLSAGQKDVTRKLILIR